MRQLFLIFICFPIMLWSQQSNGFPYAFSQTKHDYAQYCIQTKQNDIIMLVNEQLHGVRTNKIAIIKLNSTGILKKIKVIESDTLVFYLKRVVETNYGFMAVGGAISNTIKPYLYLIKLDTALNVVSQTLKELPYTLQEVATDFGQDSSIIIGGSISYKNYTIPRLFGAKVDRTGNFAYLKYQYPLDTSFFNINYAHPYVGFFDSMISMKDSTRYVFFDGIKIQSVDSNFNVVHQSFMPDIPSYSLLLQPTAMRINDTMYYVAGKGNEQLQGGSLYASVMTLSGRYQRFVSLKTTDKIEFMAFYKCIDTTELSIYVGGTLNYPIYCLNRPYCLDTSEFVLYKLDKNFNKIRTTRYGKNGLFIMNGLLATSDGGCLMYGYRYLKNIEQKTDAYIIKVDGNGVVTSETTIPIAQASITAYPNPSTGQLNFKKETPSVLGRFDVSVFDITGKLVFQKKETDLSETFDLTHLAEGNYMYQIQQQGIVKAVGKWVKMK